MANLEFKRIKPAKTPEEREKLLAELNEMVNAKPLPLAWWSLKDCEMGCIRCRRKCILIEKITDRLQMDDESISIYQCPNCKRKIADVRNL